MCSSLRTRDANACTQHLQARPCRSGGSRGALRTRRQDRLVALGRCNTQREQHAPAATRRVAHPYFPGAPVPGRVIFAVEQHLTQHLDRLTARLSKSAEFRSLRIQITVVVFTVEVEAGWHVRAPFWIKFAKPPACSRNRHASRAEAPSAAAAFHFPELRSTGFHGQRVP